MEYGILELVDAQGEPITRPGVIGRVVGTGFDNDCMPLIRYATDDLAMLADGECGCGRKHTHIADFKGRVREFIVLRSGQLMPLCVLFAGHGPVWGKLREWDWFRRQKVRSQWMTLVSCLAAGARRGGRSRSAGNFAGGRRVEPRGVAAGPAGAVATH